MTKATYKKKSLFGPVVPETQESVPKMAGWHGSRQTGQLEEQAGSSGLQSQTKGRKITNWRKEEASALKAHLIYFIQHGHKS